MCLWTPLDDPSTTWKALPRYCFEGDNFSMWNYIDIHGNWTAPWMRVTAGISDAAHKNGVAVGCVMSIPFGDYISNSQWTSNQYAKIFQMLIQKSFDGQYVYAEKFVKFLKYYGINGVGVNSEFNSSAILMQNLQDFFAKCHEIAAAENWDFQLHWYDGTNDNGGISFDAGLGSHNDGWFGKGDKKVTDMMFFNYNWSQAALRGSETYAASMNRSSYDLYAGFDIQGRALKTTHSSSGWQNLKNSKISIGFWGAHSQSLIHQSSTDLGSEDIAVQTAYLEKQEKIFSGGKRNPAVVLPLRNDATLSNSDLSTFHGLSQYLTAKSTITQVPFVTRFNLGNGLKFYNEGKVAYDHKWYNLSTQDFLPTWRWWITDRTDQATAGNMSSLIQANFTFDDAYFGGSALALHGATDFSRVRLFKTQLETQPNYELSLTYKLKKGTATKAKLFVALKNNPTEFKEIAVTDAAAEGEWTTFKTPLSALGLGANDVISMMGIVLEGTDADYQMTVGRLAVVDPAKDYGTVKPTVKEVEMIRGRYNALDFKIRYASREESGYEKTYNDEVGTWYYEIYFEQENQPQKLLTATESWAAYVIDCPLVSGTEGRKGRFGVRAVSPDGVKGSDISWSEWMDIPYNQPLDNVVISKPIVKPNEKVTIGLEDQMSALPKKWEILDPKTGAAVFQAENCLSFEAQLPNVGTYDLRMTANDGKVTMTRGKVQITPEETGAVPEITTINAPQTANMGETVNYAYEGRLGEGKVSRALRVEDPNMFMVPGEVQEGNVYSYALWFKADKFSHDRFGTNLINKNTVADKWPFNNWGDLWVVIREAIPQGKNMEGVTMRYEHAANEIGFDVRALDRPHEGPTEGAMTTGYSVTPGVWNHLVISQDAGKTQRVFFNGKKVAETTYSAALRREDMGDGRINTNAVANIFVGGGGVYKAGFNGLIDEFQVWNKAITTEDEVSEMMKGYAEGAAPEGLQAYFTFEEIEGNGTFKNLGRMSDKAGSLVKMTGSGGENTSNAAYEQQTAKNDEMGYPGIVGSLNISTTALWTLPGATDAPAGARGLYDTPATISKAVTYGAAGVYDVKLALSNLWGTAVKELPQYITISETTGINPIVIDANKVEIFDLSGRRVQKPVRGGVYIINGKKVLVH